jgi:hypothetical protein
MTLQGPPFSRDQDLACAMRCIAAASCCAVVGVSNTGKSMLLRALSTPEVRRHYLKSQAKDYALIYVDCNLMVELTEQGFYELVLRSALTELRALSASPDLADRIGNLYHQVVDSANPFLVPLGFNESIIALSEGLERRVVFLFDEFDEPLLNIDERVFLNLRALKDRYGDRLAYVTATEARLGKMRSGEAVSEFAELFAHNILFLTMLSEADTHQLVAQFMSEVGVKVSPEDQAFVREQAGGHPGLTIATCRVLAELGGGAAGLSDLSHRLVRENLDNDPNVQNECLKLWNDLTTGEQEVLMSLITHPREALPEGEQRSLTEKGILNSTNKSQRLFGRLFEDYVRRQKLLVGHAEGVRVDVESGNVWVDGILAPTLTDLEYRLMLLLYGRLNKICDKYTIVESVWGEEYIEEVDDARIEKLLSRLRQKIEPDPSKPRYITTVRGRGYRLTSSR